MNTAIHPDAVNYDPAEELFHRWTKDAEEPSENDEPTEEEPDEETEEPEAEESESEATPDSEADEADDSEPVEEDEADSEPVKTVIDSDEAVVKIKVDGQEVEASIKDLKRLYGQEAALTRKSQEAADIRKRAEESGAKHVAGLESLLERARKQAEPYANLNFLALTKDPNISKEELTALSEAAQSAFENVRFLESELDGVIKFHQNQRHEQMVSQARETHKLLSDPKTGIEGWGEPLYNDIRDFAVSQGLDRSIVNEIVDPVGIKILHMAMQYAKGKKAVSDVKVTKKVDKSPKKIVKGASAEVSQKAKSKQKTTAIKRLQQTGSTDDAAEAFLARWSQD